MVAGSTLTAVEVEEAVEVSYPRLEVRVEVLAIDVAHETALGASELGARQAAGLGLAVAHFHGC